MKLGNLEIRHGTPVQWRRGRIVEYKGDVARYGEVAKQYEGGPAWQTDWQLGRLRVVLRDKDLPLSRRRHSRYGKAGDPVSIAVDGQEMEFRPDDVQFQDGRITMMIEDYIFEIKEP